MGKLIDIKGFIKKRFDPLGAPAESTVRKWCVEGDIPAIKIGSIWYIEIDTDLTNTADDSLVTMVLEDN